MALRPVMVNIKALDHSAVGRFWAEALGWSAYSPGVTTPIWSAVHGLAALTGQGPLREVGDTERVRLEELLLAFVGESLR